MTVHSGRRPMLNASRPAAIQASTPCRSNGTPATMTCTIRATSHTPIAAQPIQRTAGCRAGAGASAAAGTSSVIVVSVAKQVRLRQIVSSDRTRAAEATITGRVRQAGLPEMPAVEIGPGRVDEHQLGIGRLPQQEVRSALLARGADEQVDVGQSGLVEMGGDGPLVDL